MHHKNRLAAESFEELHHLTSQLADFHEQMCRKETYQSIELVQFQRRSQKVKGDHIVDRLQIISPHFLDLQMSLPSLMLIFE